VSVHQLILDDVELSLELIVLELQLNHQRTILVLISDHKVSFQELHPSFVIINQLLLLSLTD